MKLLAVIFAFALVALGAVTQASVITKWMNPGAPTKFGASYISLNPATLAENDYLSGTKVEAKIALTLEQGGPEAPTWKTKDFKIEWLNHTAGTTIHERATVALECEAFHFRYATTLVDHLTNLQFKVTGKVSWQRDANQNDIWNDVDLTFTFRAYNLANITTTARDSNGDIHADFDNNATQFYSLLKAELDVNHSIEPASATIAKSRDFVAIVETVIPSTVFLASLHANLTQMEDSYVNDSIRFLQDVLPEVLDKPNELPLRIPSYNIVALYACETISLATGASIAAAAFDVATHSNRAYLGFNSEVAILCYTQAEWTIVETQLKSGQSVTILPTTPIAKHGERVMKQLQLGFNLKQAVESANSAYIPVVSDPNLEPPIQARPLIVIGDKHFRLKFVYFSEAESALLPNETLLNVWWIRLPVYTP